MRLHGLIVPLATFLLSYTAFADWQWKAHPGTEEEFKNSAVVILGKVVSSKDVPEPGAFTRGTLYTIKVAEVFKGTQSKTIKLFSENSSGRFPMKIDASYLIFAYKGVFEGIQGPRLAINNVGNSGTVKESEKALNAVRKLRK
jgi:hypothetical protein